MGKSVSAFEVMVQISVIPMFLRCSVGGQIAVKSTLCSGSVMVLC